MKYRATSQYGIEVVVNIHPKSTSRSLIGKNVRCQRCDDTIESDYSFFIERQGTLCIPCFDLIHEEINMAGPYKRTPQEYLCKSRLCKIWNHWLNPLSNWLEPFPYPEKRKEMADKSWLPNMLWWELRNPVHNFVHHWIGIVPVGEHGSWYSPESRGWVREKPSKTLSVWRKGWIRLPYWHGGFKIGDTPWQYYFGWTSRGNFGVAVRRDQRGRGD